MKYKLVLFDFDGTIMDTSEGIFECGRQSLSDLGIPVPEDAEWERFIGPPLKDCFRFAFHIENDDTLEKLCVAYRKHYIAEGFKKACFYPGIKELFVKLRSEGYKIGIASMKNTMLIEKMNDYFGITPFIDCLEGQGTESTVEKDELVRILCKKYSIKTSQCVLVGDTMYDYKGAVDSGAASIKVNYGFGFKPGDDNTVSDADGIYRKITEE